MAVELMVKADAGKLVGATAADMEAICEADGGTFRAVLTTPKGRSLDQLALWWVVCGMIADNYPGDLDKDAVSDVLKIECGHALIWQDASGLYRRTPKSIAFNKLAQDDFSKLMDRMLGKAAELFGAGLAEAAAAELAKIATPMLERAA